MKLRCKESFEAYPNDTYRQFTAGEIVEDIPDEYAQMLIDKGHAELAAPTDEPSLPLVGGKRK